MSFLVVFLRTNRSPNGEEQPTKSTKPTPKTRNLETNSTICNIRKAQWVTHTGRSPAGLWTRGSSKRTGGGWWGKKRKRRYKRKKMGLKESKKENIDMRKAMKKGERREARDNHDRRKKLI